MSTTQLDILALEPFYGGARRVMLESVTHCSRHRWTLLKLPPRRIERRLTAASHWFAEQLSRHWAGRCDLLFTSEALNLADLYRLVPALLKKPSVVYFHSNQLPEPDAVTESPTDLVNLNTAAAATECWFNSMFHLRSFLAKAGGMVNRHPELMARNPLPQLSAKSHVIRPPVDYSMLQQLAQQMVGKREKRTIFVETRDADTTLLNHTLTTLRRRGETFKLITIGNLDGLSTEISRQTLPENDDVAQMAGMLRAGIFLSVRPNAPADHHAIRALAAGCLPICPAVGVYRELIPESLHSHSLYKPDVDHLVGRLQDLWHLDRPSGYIDRLNEILREFDPIESCKRIDTKLLELAMHRPATDSS